MKMPDTDTTIPSGSFETTQNDRARQNEEFKRMLENEPKVISSFVPVNGQEQKRAFLNGEIDAPNNDYAKLRAYDFDSRRRDLKKQGNELASLARKPIFAEAYTDLATRYVAMTDLMEAARTVKDDPSAEHADAYMAINKELYGEPEESVYRSLLTDKLNAIDEKEMSESARVVRRELQESLTPYECNASEERYRPRPETVEWMHDVVESLYGNLLKHVPELPEGKKTFDASDTQAVFTSILHDEFGEAAKDWRVDIEDAQSINVKVDEKRIVIPTERKVGYQKLRSLVVHEIGVHVLRALEGGDTDVPPLRVGLDGSMDSEEGLGVVMEQALAGKYSEAGTDHYITAGLAAIDSMGFRDVFDVKWRLAALSSYKSGTELDKAAIDKAKNTAYGQTMRSFRGTDSLPLFKDLAYYNGARDVWSYLDTICGDDLMLSLVFLGKSDPSRPTHRRVVLESSTS